MHLFFELRNCLHWNVENGEDGWFCTRLSLCEMEQLAKYTFN